MHMPVKSPEETFQAENEKTKNEQNGMLHRSLLGGVYWGVSQPAHVMGTCWV